MLLEPSRHFKNPRFGGVIFRRTYPRITNEGGLWDESLMLYPNMHGKPKENPPQWRFPSGASLQFRHLEYEKNLEDWKGAQVPFFGFDELTEFTERMFWYLLSRNRSTCGVRPYIRATCNPDSESWVARLIDWWIDEDGYPDPSKSGVIRWFIRLDETLHWFNSREEAVDYAIECGVERDEAKDMPKSFTFIPAKLDDNPTLMQKDPGYKANLMALPLVDRLRLLGGNWKVRPNVGLMFPRNRWDIVDVAPAGLQLCRAWDKAGTEAGHGARTAGVLVGYHVQTMKWYIVHCTTGRWNDIDRERHMQSIARRDDSMFGGGVMIMIEQEPGSGGKQSAISSVRHLKGHAAFTTTVTGEKASRWRPFAAQVQAGNVAIVNDGSWDVEDFITELDNLSGDKEQDKTRLKDIADAASLAFNTLANATSSDLPENLLCSGDDENWEEESERVPDDQLSELPPVVADILRDVRKHPRRDWD